MRLLLILIPLFPFFDNSFAQHCDTIGSDMILFDFGKYNLDEPAQIIINSMSNVARNLEADRIVITAHTDSIGSIEANRKLSLNRALTVKKAFVGNGIDSTLTEIHWHGEVRPIASNQTEIGRYANRRAAVFLLKMHRKAMVEGRITSEENNQGLEALLIFTGKHFKDSVRTDSTGVYRIHLPDTTVLAVDVFARGYIYKSMMFKTATEKLQILDFSLIPATPGLRFPLHKLFFVGNKAILLDKSLPELNRLLLFMRLNDSIHVEIAGHVNFPNRGPVPTDSWEFDLSFRRARMVYQHLVENGIDQDRLLYNGYGNWEMVYPNARLEEHQAANRRVEVRIKQ